MKAKSIRVLHVSETLLGGVATSIASYLSNTPEIDHRIAGVPPQQSRWSQVASEIGIDYPLGRGHATRIREISALLDDVTPDLIHCHSSYAGFYCRAGRIHRRVPVVYSPHCYAFLRQDLSAPMRLAIHRAEFLLARRSLTAAIGEHELELARKLGGMGAFFLPHAVEPSQAARPKTQPQDGQLLIVGAGRLSPQKDPDFFIQACKHASAAGIRARWLWIGGGDSNHRARLNQAHIEVTGWVNHDEAVGLLASADAYVHSAAWEGFPLTILEACAMGIPTAAREIGPTRHLDLYLMSEPSDVVAFLQLLREPNHHSQLVKRAKTIASYYSPESQSRALRRIYSEALGRAN